ncbi:FKBP-type peptidyl prolyl cis-trans isomerase /apo-metallochaperone SlyD [Algoriphagus boseongensis]|uniref:Peptidyl-prolyl cis-trans isomerase n=1 Tax=Algoriphagus boseongensis TaxID=1442587 RepID=A0A4R6T8F1_9BACT|nr:peptidylprolyl isomerase [Algoriphagus boseongensis]TDQ17238.1 FKBP-type peptidyl prolyl cis-trans isomerase /apo-metallochaperone SlyD [Algoriphagus boseongensis]
MKAEKNKVVAVSYTLKVDDGESGPELFETVADDSPFYFLVGYQNVLPKFEEVIIGKEVGETFSVFIDFENGYGDYDEAKKVIIPKANFKEDGKKNKDLLKVGQVIPMQDDKGNQMRGEIIKIDYRGVHMDFNPPLAGFDLYFEGKVIAIRDAEPVELEHGHAHGPDGHHH